MADKIYVDQPVKVELEISVDGQPMSGALSAVIAVRKPDQSEEEWTADISGATISYDITDELDQSGNWLLQPSVEIGAVTLPGTTVQMPVHRRFT